MDGRPVLACAAAGVRVPDDPRHGPVHPPAAARRVRSVRSERGRPGRAARRPRSAGKTLGGDGTRARRIRGRAAGRRRRRVCAAPAPSRVRRLPGGAGAAALELDRHGRAIAGRPPPRPRAAGSASPAARLGRHAAHHPAMTFRTRILIGFGVVVLVPFALFGVRVRTAVATRLTDEYERRVATRVAVIRTHLARDGAAIARRLEALTDAIAAEIRFREAVVQGGNRTYLLDYAGGAMRFAGLSMLQIQDEQGRIVSSGHFRNEYDRLEPALPRALAAAQGGIALIRARTPEVPMLAIARLDSLRLAGRRFPLVGGIALDSSYLAALTPDS